jgi:hypothetical protein
MTEGNLARWLKKEGERVKAGDVIAEIETDKATMEVEAVDEGILGRILVPDGTQGVKVNDPIAVLVEEGEAVPAAGAKAPAADAGPKAAAPAPEAAPAAAKPVAANGADASLNPQPIPPKDGDRVFASPLAQAHGAAGGAEPVRREGLRPEWPDRESRYRGGALSRGPAAAPAAAAAPRPPPPPRRSPAARRRSAPPRAHTARAEQHDAEGDRAPPVGIEGDHPAFLRDDGYRDRRAAETARRSQCAVAEGWSRRLQAVGQRPGHQGDGGGAAALPGLQRVLDRGCDHPVPRRRYLGGGVDPGGAHHADREAGPTGRASLRSATR